MRERRIFTFRYCYLLELQILISREPLVASFDTVRFSLEIDENKPCLELKRKKLLNQTVEHCNTDIISKSRRIRKKLYEANYKNIPILCSI